MICRAAEIASGILCLCMPTLAALKPSHRQNLKRPSVSILNGRSNSRRTPRTQGSGKHNILSGRDRSVDEQDLVEYDPIEGHKGPYPMERVVTRIGVGERDVDGKGNNPRSGAVDEVDEGYPSERGHDNGEIAGRGCTSGGDEIIKTVKIEQMQTYV